MIQNRKNQNICVLVEEAKDNIGIAFVMHGSGGYKEQPHIRAMVKTFLENNYTVISFDTTHAFGKSYGKYEDSTTTNYYEDLEDVINWAKQQKWYKEPFVLAGHSLGGICISLYAQKFPNKVKALFPMSTVVSTKLRDLSDEELKNWKEKGIRQWISRSGKPKKLKWGFMEDREKYDVLKEINNLKMPVLLIVGEKDDVTPPYDQETFYNKLLGKKELHIVKDAPHTFREQPHLEELKTILNNWIKEL